MALASQFILKSVWAWLFFGVRAPISALIVMTAFVLCVIASIWLAARIDRRAALSWPLSRLGGFHPAVDDQHAPRSAELPEGESGVGLMALAPRMVTRPRRPKRARRGPRSSLRRSDRGPARRPRLDQLGQQAPPCGSR